MKQKDPPAEEEIRWKEKRRNLSAALVLFSGGLAFRSVLRHAAAIRQGRSHRFDVSRTLPACSERISGRARRRARLLASDRDSARTTAKFYLLGVTFPAFDDRSSPLNMPVVFRTLRPNWTVRNRPKLQAGTGDGRK